MATGKKIKGLSYKEVFDLVHDLVPRCQHSQELRVCLGCSCLGSELSGLMSRQASPGGLGKHRPAYFQIYCFICEPKTIPKDHSPPIQLGRGQHLFSNCFGNSEPHTFHSEQVLYLIKEFKERFFFFFLLLYMRVLIPKSRTWRKIFLLQTLLRAKSR